MRLFTCFVVFALLTSELPAQSFEIAPLQEVYQGYIGETVKVPVHLTNTSDKPVTLVVHRISTRLGGTQTNYFCPGNNCLGEEVEQVVVKLAPGETLSDFAISLDAGLASGISSVKYAVFNRYNSSESVEFDLNFAVEERSAKEDIYSSPHIIVHDVYPNPVVDYAYVNYAKLNDEIDAKIVIHNILGNPIDEYNLPSGESRVKIRADALNAGIYFYTLYLDGEGVMTRKLIVKK